MRLRDRRYFHIKKLPLKAEKQTFGKTKKNKPRRIERFSGPRGVSPFNFPREKAYQTNPCRRRRSRRHSFKTRGRLILNATRTGVETKRLRLVGYRSRACTSGYREVARVPIKERT